MSDGLAKAFDILREKEMEEQVRGEGSCPISATLAMKLIRAAEDAKVDEVLEICGQFPVLTLGLAERFRKLKSGESI